MYVYLYILYKHISIHMTSYDIDVYTYDVYIHIYIHIYTYDAYIYIYIWTYIDVYNHAMSIHSQPGGLAT